MKAGYAVSVKPLISLTDGIAIGRYNRDVRVNDHKTIRYHQK